MKKQIRGILAMALTFLMLFSSYASVTGATKTATAIPTTQNVLVNGAKVNFDAYNIGGSNYFKIRDLAFQLRNTEKSFEVKWDGQKNAINLEKGKAYTVAGGEMAKGTAGNKNASLSSSKIYVDGKEVSLTAYIINGSSYFRLVEVGEKIGFGVVWDEPTKTVLINATLKAGVVSQPTDKEIQEAFAKAGEMYDWFDGFPMSFKYEDSKGYYYRVIDIKTLFELKAKLAEVFSQDMLQELIDRDVFREFDGVLYISGGERGGDQSLGKTEFTIIRESDTKIIYRAKTEMLDFEQGKKIVAGYQTIDFPYEYQNGKWVFTDFKSIY